MDLSDEEKHALEIRRERSNKISKLMGDYLLKGYKMLGTNCNKCETILMRDRQQNDFCVACSDIDLVSSRNPHQMVQHNSDSQRRAQLSNQQERNIQRSTHAYSANGSVSQTDEYRGIIKEVESTLLVKMQWASIQMQNSSIEESFKLLQLINSCYDTLQKISSSK